MNKLTKVLLLVIVPIAIFLGVGFYDASQRATRLQSTAEESYDLCASLAVQGQGSSEQCSADLQRALADSSSLAWKAALPMALGAAAVAFLLMMAVSYFLGRRGAPVGGS